MGGRGSSVIILDSGRGDWSSTPSNIEPKTLKEAIGTKGSPKSMGDAVVETNPNYNANYNEFSLNCQRCVVAYELRRRGYDVEALPAYKGNKESKVAYSDPTKGLYHARWREAFRHAKVESVGSNTASGVKDNITQKMEKFGEGSRAVIQIFYKGGGGHVFNVEYNNGKVQYIEAQSGKIKDIDFTLAHTRTADVNIVRTDNLRISERARRYVRSK